MPKIDPDMVEPVEDLSSPPTLRRLSKQELLAGLPTPTKEVPLPRLGGTVLVRAINRQDMHAARERSTVRLKGGERIVDGEKLEKNLLVLALADPTFSYQEVDALMRQPMDIVQDILDALDELSGMSKEEREEAANAFRQ